MNSDEPAWYHVGDGRMRLWDGQQWTERYRTVDQPKAPTPPHRTPAKRTATQRTSAQPATQPPAQRAKGPGLSSGDLSDTPREAGRGSRFVTWALVAAAAIVAIVVSLSLLRPDA